MSAISKTESSAAAAASGKTPLRLPELLAPAGDWECVKAAVENGADAIYFGLDKFNARMRAQNFTEASLPKLMEFLHRRGVRGYVTFNTLVFPNELEAAEQYLRSIIAAGVDAAIVQDVGICRLIRKLSPDFPIHGSTQMTVTSVAGVEFARDLGCNLVVLARECSIAEIEKIQAAQETDNPKPAAKLPLEVFVHGALCVAYSGQCLTSESLGGRSANRGECAQACRMPYDLLSDGVQVPLGDKRYLLSPQDLAGLEVLPGLIRSGVASLKIEGRLKSPEYVASITRVYRQALDKLGSEFGVSGFESSRTATATKLETKNQKPETSAKYELEMSFSRGLFTGWFEGIDNQRLVHARFGKKRGVYLGKVVKVLGERVIVKLEGALKPGDGVVFDAGKPEEGEEGGRVYEIFESRTVTPGAREVGLTFKHGAIKFAHIQPGHLLWKTNDPELDKRVRQTFEGDQIRYQRPISMEVHGLAGKPFTLIARDENGHIVQKQSEVMLAIAEKTPLSTERLKEQLGRLGGTPFRLGELTNHLEGNVILPVSELNRIRREVAAELEAQCAAPKQWTLVAEPVSAKWSAPVAEVPAGNVATKGMELIVLVRNLAQLETALTCGAETIYCEFEDPKKYREAVTLYHTARGCKAPMSSSQAGIFVLPPRIFKSGEEWILNLVRSSNADGYIVRNYEHLKFFAGSRLRGDFSLNVANPLTAEYFIQRYGLERVTASYDLNVTQLEALLSSTPAQHLEITLHQHMPMFHMEHCVFCAFLSKGKDYHDCGRPCEKHEVKLRDRVGALHTLKADAGCRNTVFNSMAQTGAEYFERMVALGARQFRIDFLNETPEQVTQTIAKYRQLLRGEITGQQLYRELKLVSQLGVTRGQLEGLRVEPTQRK
jgi:putative protease